MEGVKHQLIIVMTVLVFLAACASAPAVVCNDPYILVGGGCCLDSNHNKICDSDDGLLAMANGTYDCPETDCSLCPAQIVEKKVEVKVKSYICEKDGSEVDNPAKCAGNKANNPFENYTPYTGAEARSVLETFTLRPACRDSKHALELHYIAGSLPGPVTIQVKKSPTAEWEDVYTLDGSAKEAYLYGVFCQIQCTGNADWFLDPDAVYLLRAKFDFNRIYGEYQYSNEYIVDAREDGDYLTKLC